MNRDAEPARKSPGNDLDLGWMLVDARLKKLRRERHLVERAIVALTEISRTRQSRDRRANRN
jgi:hypothetical protein